jgi:hypothetical protein
VFFHNKRYDLKFACKITTKIAHTQVNGHFSEKNSDIYRVFVRPEWLSGACLRIVSPDAQSRTSVRFSQKIPITCVCTARCERIFEVGRQSRVGVLEITTKIAHT